MEAFTASTRQWRPVSDSFQQNSMKISRPRNVSLSNERICKVSDSNAILNASTHCLSPQQYAPRLHPASGRSDGAKTLSADRTLRTKSRARKCERRRACQCAAPCMLRMVSACTRFWIPAIDRAVVLRGAKPRLYPLHMFSDHSRPFPTEATRTAEMRDKKPRTCSISIGNQKPGVPAFKV